MGLERVRAENFRCVSQADIEPAPTINLITGPNGAGKTSLLEAIFFLGRARSFRAPQASSLVQTGTECVTVFGEIRAAGGLSRLGIRARRGGMEIQVDGKPGTAAALAAACPVQIIEPAVHELVQGGPERRRQFLDWGVFHVKPSFLPEWRRYRRALRQRNAALRAGAADEAVEVWNADLVSAGVTIDQARRAFLADFEPDFREVFRTLTGLAVECEYGAGWKSGEDLADAIHDSLRRDRSYQSTQCGPHRAELRLRVAAETARHRLSRGQQKLLGAALVLAQAQFVRNATGAPVVLLVDEPAAELDREHLHRLLATLVDSSLQLFLTALDDDVLPLPERPRVFHVKRGEVTNLL